MRYRGGVLSRPQALAAIIALLLAGGAVALAGCGEARDPNHPKMSCEGFAASDDRTALAYLDDARLLVRTAAGTRSFARPACMKKGGGRLFVGPGGAAVAAFAQRSSIPGDLWGHAGKVTAVACAVDLESGQERELDTSRPLTWIDGVAAAVPEDKLLANSAKECRAGSTKEEAWVGCASWRGRAATLAVRRYRGAQLAPLGEARELDADALVGGGFSPEHYAFSPDGRRLAIWGKKLVVLEVASGAVLGEVPGWASLSAVEFDPSGGERLLLVGELAAGAPGGSYWQAKIVGFDGQIAGDAGAVAWSRRVYWTEPRAYWVADACQAERRTLAL